MFVQSVILFLLLHVVEGNFEYGNSSEATGYYIAGGVMLLVAMIMLVVLCADGGAVEPGSPLPGWTMSLQIDPALNTGFDSCSGGLTILDPNTVQRHRVGKHDSDGARWGAGMSKGKHVFEIHWPKMQRSIESTIGVGTADSPLHMKPNGSLVGSNSKSWGLDIGKYRAMHKGEALCIMPKSRNVPETFIMYVDCDSGTLAFGTAQSYWGAHIYMDRNKYPVYAMIGTAFQTSTIRMTYKGSEVKRILGESQMP